MSKALLRSRAAALTLSSLIVISVAASLNAWAREPTASQGETKPPATNLAVEAMKFYNQAQKAKAGQSPATPSDDEKPGPMAKAILFSSEGIGFFFVQGRDDTYDYKPLLKTLRQTMTMDTIPAKIYGGRSEKSGTYLLFFVQGVTYNGDTVASLRSENRTGYKPDDIRNGRVSFEAKRAYEQAFLKRYP